MVDKVKEQTLLWQVMVRAGCPVLWLLVVSVVVFNIVSCRCCSIYHAGVSLLACSDLTKSYVVTWTCGFHSFHLVITFSHLAITSPPSEALNQIWSTVFLHLATIRKHFLFFLVSCPAQELSNNNKIWGALCRSPSCAINLVLSYKALMSKEHNITLELMQT